MAAADDVLEDGAAVEGLLFDVNPVTRDGRTALRLWVKVDGTMVRVVDPDFASYFYVTPAEGVDAEELARGVAATEAGGARPTGAEVVARRRGLEDVPVVRATTLHPGDVPPLREKLRQSDHVDEVLEADIPFHLRYIIDKRLAPMDGVAFTARRGEDGTWLAETPRRVARDGADEELSVLAFDIEVHNPRRVPDAGEDPVVIISIATGDGHVELLQADGRDDAGLVRRFVDRVRELDPDVLLTYNGDSFDWPYLADRAEAHGVKLAVGRDGSEPEQRQAGPTRAVRVAGRANVDLYHVARRDLGEVKVKTLENVADHLGVMDKDARASVPRDRIAEYWDDPELRPRLLEYARDDVVATLDLGRALVPLQAAFARMTRQPLEDASKMGRGRQVDWFLMDAAFDRGILIPNKGHAGEEVYEGGFVMEPREGLHEDIQALDFSSMYPSIMVAYNISPDTVAGDDCSDCFEAPGVGHRFRKAPDGFFRQILQGLLDRRRGVKERMAQVPAGSVERRLLDVRQRSLKILTNAFYGYMGWAQARWYSHACAEATTAWGRHLIQDVIRRGEARGIDVIYGDTDSVFVRAAPDLGEFVEEVNRELPLELEVEERYEVIFFTGAKKRYAGLTTEGEVVVRGLEVRRGDWCDLAKAVQRDVLDIILHDRDPEKAARVVRDVVDALKAGEVDVADLTIHKTLTQRPEEYKVKQAHVLAVEAAVAEDPDFRVPVGAKVGYVITTERQRTPATMAGLAANMEGAQEQAGPAKMSERAKLAEFLEPGDEVDADYYIDKQVMPAVLRVLEHFGYTEEDLKGLPKQRSLLEF